VADANVFAQTLAGAVAVEQPPPTSSDVVATSLGGLGSLGTQNFFTPSARRRVVVVLTDGESEPFDAGAVAHDLAAAPGVRLVLVHVGSAREAVYDGGRPEQGYHAPAGSGALLDSLAMASGGRVFPESDAGGAIRSVRAAIGHGPTVREGRTERTQTLAPYVALLALAPLVLLFTGLGSGLV